MNNRYPGKCACGTWVSTGEGTTFKSATKWEVRCSFCDAQATAPKREMFGTIYWPNGLGETECTEEYQDAVNGARDARQAVEEFDGNPRDDDDRKRLNNLEHAAFAAENKVATLQIAGGHVGEIIRYDEPDPMTALLGGGRVNILPGGGMRVAG